MPKEIFGPVFPFSKMSARLANRMLAICYLFILALTVIVELSEWTHTAEVRPLSALISKTEYVLLFHTYSVFDLFLVTNLQIVCGLIFLIDALTNGLGVKKFVIVVIGVGLSYILCTVIFTGCFVFFMCLVAAYPSRLSLRNAIVCYLLTSASFTLLTISLALLGHISTTISFEHGVLRHSLGFNYTNGFAVTTSSLVMAWVYLKSPTWNWRDVCISIALIIIILTISDGRSACAFALMQVIITSLFHANKLSVRIREAGSSILYKLATWLFPIMSVLSLACLPCLAMVKGTPFYGALNTLLSTRPATWLEGFSQNGYLLFSTPLNTPATCDNAFLHIMWTCGIVTLAFFAILYVLTGKWTERRKNLPLAIYITLFILHCFTEVLVYDFNMGFIILPIGAALANVSFGSSICDARTHRESREK